MFGEKQLNDEEKKKLRKQRNENFLTLENIELKKKFDKIEQERDLYKKRSDILSEIEIYLKVRTEKIQENFPSEVVVIEELKRLSQLIEKAVKFERKEIEEWEENGD